MQIVHYFAYGSNMNPDRVAQRKLQVVSFGSGYLENYCLQFNKCARDHPRIGHANIEYDFGSTVEGVLYELNSSTEILKMDPFEKAPWNYGREVVSVKTHECDIWAWTYFANSAMKQADLQPSQSYLNHLLCGKKWLSEEYFERLAGTPALQDL